MYFHFVSLLVIYSFLKCLFFNCTPSTKPTTGTNTTKITISLVKRTIINKFSIKTTHNVNELSLTKNFSNTHSKSHENNKLPSNHQKINNRPVPVPKCLNFKSHNSMLDSTVSLIDRLNFINPHLNKISNHADRKTNTNHMISNQIAQKSKLVNNNKLHGATKQLSVSILYKKQVSHFIL